MLHTDESLNSDNGLNYSRFLTVIQAKLLVFQVSRHLIDRVSLNEDELNHEEAILRSAVEPLRNRLASGNTISTK